MTACRCCGRASAGEWCSICVSYRCATGDGWCGGEAPVDASQRWGVPQNDAADEQLRADLVAITEAERQALRDGACFIAASGEKFPAVQRLAAEVNAIAAKPAFADREVSA